MPTTLTAAAAPAPATHRQYKYSQSHRPAKSLLASRVKPAPSEKHHPAIVPTVRDLAEEVELCRRAQRVAQLRGTPENRTKAREREERLDGIVAELLRLRPQRPAENDAGQDGVEE